MSQAVIVVFYIYNKVIDLLFNKIQLISGVSLGWVILVILLFGIVFNSLLNIPKLGIMNTGKEGKSNKNE